MGAPGGDLSLFGKHANYMYKYYFRTHFVGNTERLVKKSEP